MKRIFINLRLLATVLLGIMVFCGCEEIEKLDKESEERNLRNLTEWSVNSFTSESAISKFGYENCFKIVAMDDYWWDEFMSFDHGAQYDVSKNDFSSVRSLFYCQNSMSHIRIGEIICNKSIANDLLTIFRQLYEANYNIESLMPVNNTDYSMLTEQASPSFNFTFCFHYNSTPIDEMHLKGLAVVINPYTPPTADDLAVKLFKQHGFTWGGDVSGGKRYRFEKK